MRLRCDDIDLVAVTQFAPEWHHTAINLGADATVADLGMDCIGKVHGGRAFGQGDQIAARCEAEYLVLEHFELGMLQEFLRFGGMLDDVQEFTEPSVLRSGASVFAPAFAFLVIPVCGNAVFGDVVHLGGSDLEFDALAFRPENTGMEGTVSIRFWRRQVILETARHHRIGTMGNSKSEIAILNRVDNDPKGHDVGQLFEAEVLVLHLVPHRIRGFFASFDDRINAFIGEGFF